MDKLQTNTFVLAIPQLILHFTGAQNGVKPCNEDTQETAIPTNRAYMQLNLHHRRPQLSRTNLLTYYQNLNLF